MSQVLIRDVRPDVLAALKTRARAHRRSLQGELLALLEQAAVEPPVRSPASVAARIREALGARGGTFTDSTPLVREDRER